MDTVLSITANSVEMADSCCLQGFEWSGTPIGKETKFNDQTTYVTGSNKDAAILVVADLFGWTFNNIRLLADHYAKEANATVYVPDLYDSCPPEPTVETHSLTKI